MIIKISHIKHIIYDISNTEFLQEISNILFGFNLIDNFSTSESIKNNFTIEFSGSALKINNMEDIIDSNENLEIIKTKFKSIDTSFEIIYDFSDNQYNSSE